MSCELDFHDKKLAADPVYHRQLPNVHQWWVHDLEKQKGYTAMKCKLTWPLV